MDANAALGYYGLVCIAQITRAEAGDNGADPGWLPKLGCAAPVCTEEVIE
jgi:hypothetical protein